jgi:hypothetical protein
MMQLSPSCACCSQASLQTWSDQLIARGPGMWLCAGMFGGAHAVFDGCALLVRFRWANQLLLLPRLQGCRLHRGNGLGICVPQPPPNGAREAQGLPSLWPPAACAPTRLQAARTRQRGGAVPPLLGVCLLQSSQGARWLPHCCTTPTQLHALLGSCFRPSAQHFVAVTSQPPACLRASTLSGCRQHQVEDGTSAC